MKKLDRASGGKDLLRGPGIRPAEVVEKFVRSSGRGGQNVNKTSTCVWLKHLPTGIEVKVQTARSQARNRETAYRLLSEKIAAAGRAEQQRKVREREKERRRKRPRPAGLKELILETKRRTAEKKKLRGKTFEG